MNARPRGALVRTSSSAGLQGGSDRAKTLPGELSLCGPRGLDGRRLTRSPSESGNGSIALGAIGLPRLRAVASTLVMEEVAHATDATTSDGPGSGVEVHSPGM
ncbi:MAG: hypothetical protein ACHREM_05965 [Polyangiales bacterium]